jgi:hypothetical protein
MAKHDPHPCALVASTLPPRAEDDALGQQRGGPIDVLASTPARNSCMAGRPGCR